MFCVNIELGPYIFFKSSEIVIISLAVSSSSDSTSSIKTNISESTVEGSDYGSRSTSPVNPEVEREEKSKKDPL